MENEISLISLFIGRPPENWEKVIEGIRKMTSSEEAPIDAVECDRTGSFLPPKVEDLTLYGNCGIAEFVPIGFRWEYAVRYAHCFLKYYFPFVFHYYMVF